MSDNLGSLESFRQLKLEKSCTPMRLPPLYTSYAKVSMPAICNVKQKLLEHVSQGVLGESILSMEIPQQHQRTLITEIE